MVAFAIGALLGDTVFHLIPHSFGIHDEEDDEHGHGKEEEEDKLNPKLAGVLILGGILFFYVLEKILHSFGIVHTHE